MKQTLQIIHSDTAFVQENKEQVPPFVDKKISEEYAYVASRIGKYYYPTNCSKAKSLSTKNMLYFKDIMTAEQAGYVSHKDCF